MVFRSQSPQIDDLGQPLNINGQPSMSVNDEITIRMSPQHAKAFAALLNQQVDTYEKNFHVTLPLPPELEALWKQHVKGK
jgi:hypothetical protein